MKIARVVLRHVGMKLKAPFKTSFGTTTEKEFLLVEAYDEDGVVGYGESTAMTDPYYNEETLKSNHHLLRDYLIPLVLNNTFAHPDECVELFAPIRRNMMAKAAMEGAIWDLYAKREGLSLARALGGVKERIPVGVSIGIQPDITGMLQQVERFLAEGYQRIKVKIMPGFDVDVIAAIRREFGDIPLMADANSAYTLKDAEHLKKLDAFHLMMIEQPLAHDDIVDHATLQRQLETPLCLDESIHTVEDARKALDLGSCRIINIKVGRVGGLSLSKQIQELCASRNVPVWCGGMLESGIGRAHNIAITTLPGFVLPGDTSGSNRYWHADIIEPEVTVENGFIQVPESPGIGYRVDRRRLDACTLASETYR
ncbi:o-succinylbenzoate synthase [Brevibacillus sp. SYP-B805]|uniref:o-succinylbenzoate synthase n=1 Tax=Brevibacillus sp. SYP-B805 TaxID=1578199 RepID=UPI0013EB4A9D|nr:o-succinylbenzoate synthase [Brevibacillus sp. SYP-B805]NGQ97274.1 o-succinylbenzoate synthase [Brevibacillus sp. SYP-B805]